MLALAHPGGAVAVQRIAPLVLDEAQATLDRVPLRWRVVEHAFRIDGSGQTREAVFDRLVVSGRAGLTAFELDLASGGRRIPLRLHEGEWFVDPGASLLGSVLALLPAEGAPPLGLDDLVEVMRDTVVGELTGSVPQLAAALADPTTPERTTSDDDADDGDPILAERCYELADVDEAIACFAAGIEEATIDRAEVPVELRFPECGAATAAWAGYAALSDEAFIALVTEVRPCLLERIADGRLTDDELPLAFVDPACFEGRNWFAVLDDPDYTDRVLECVTR